jgi:hypothetical protein
MSLRYIGLISVLVAALILGAAAARAGDDPCAEPNDQAGTPCMLNSDAEVQGFLDAFQDRVSTPLLSTFDPSGEGENSEAGA